MFYHRFDCIFKFDGGQSRWVVEVRLQLAVLVLASLLLLGCVSSEVSKVQATPTPSNQKVSQATPIPTPTPEVKTFKVADVGESLSNDKLTVTLNSVTFMDKIVPKTVPNVGDDAAQKKAEEMMTQKAADGKTFAVLDVTVENKDSEATSISSLIQFKVKDQEGFSYQPDLVATVYQKQQIDGTLQPGDKTRGIVAFEVPKAAKGLQFVFNFGAFDQAQAKFNLGDVK